MVNNLRGRNISILVMSNTNPNQNSGLLVKKTSLKKKQEVKDILQKFNIRNFKSSKPSASNTNSSNTNSAPNIIVKKEGHSTDGGLPAGNSTAQTPESQQATPNSNPAASAVENAKLDIHKPKIATLKAAPTTKLIKKQNAILDSINNLITQPIQDPGNIPNTTPAIAKIEPTTKPQASNNNPTSIKVIKVNDEKGHLKNNISKPEPVKISPLSATNTPTVLKPTVSTPPSSPHPIRARTASATASPTAIHNLPLPVIPTIPLVPKLSSATINTNQQSTKNINTTKYQPTPKPAETRTLTINTKPNGNGNGNINITNTAIPSAPNSKSLSANSQHKQQSRQSQEIQLKSITTNTVATNPNLVKMLEYNKKLEAQKLAVLQKLKEQKQKLQAINDRRQEIAMMNHIKKSNQELFLLKQKLKDMETKQIEITKQPTKLAPPQSEPKSAKESTTPAKDAASQQIQSNDDNPTPTPKTTPTIQKTKGKNVESPQLEPYKYNPISKLPLVLKLDNQIQNIPESFNSHSINISLVNLLDVSPLANNTNNSTDVKQQIQQLDTKFGFKKDFGDEITNFLYQNMCNSNDGIEYIVNFTEKRRPPSSKKLFNVDDDIYSNAKITYN